MYKRIQDSFLIQLAALLISILVVHLIYLSVIEPQAQAALKEIEERFATGEAFIPKQSIYVILRDIYQETCFILMFWALAIVGIKTWNTITERKMLTEDLLAISEGTSILPEDARSYIRVIQDMPLKESSRLLPRTVLLALQRFETTRNVHSVAESVRNHCESEADKLDSELSMIRYIAWAIPSIGFIGTVRGIGEALGQAYLAVQGEITGVTESLGVAFNSTFVALVISIFLMAFVYQLQRVQEQLVIDTQNWCDDQLVRRMQAS